MSVRVRLLCQSCGNQGAHDFSDSSQPSWCTCTKAYGPIVAAPGTIVRMTFESKENAVFRAECLIASNAFFEAKDALSERWVKCGRGWRELPASHPKVRGLHKAYNDALAELEWLQSLCRHPSRCLFSRIHCDVCHAHVECDVAHYRHLVKVAGKRMANRVEV